MKSFLCFLAILLSAHYLLAETPSQSDDGAQNNRRGDCSNVGTCSKGIDEGGEGDFVPVLSNVTVSQYCDFLNAVAADDSHRLYDEQMGSDRERACIKRAGTPGNYTYSVIEGKGEYPITFVSWFNQARFCNWMENGQPVGPQGPETTEEGSYTLSGATDKMVCLNEGKTYFLPTQKGKEAQINIFNPSSLQLLHQSQSGFDPFQKSSKGFSIGVSIFPSVGDFIPTSQINFQSNLVPQMQVMTTAEIEEAEDIIERAVFGGEKSIGSITSQQVATSTAKTDVPAKTVIEPIDFSPPKTA